LTTVTFIPTSRLASIGEGVFSNTPLTSITIPTSVTSIGSIAFQVCTALTSITIPNSVTSIIGDAFLNSGLKNVTIANNQLAGITSPAPSVAFFGVTVQTFAPI